MRVTLTTPVSSEHDTSAGVGAGAGGLRMASRLGPNYGRKQNESQAKQVIRNSVNRSSSSSAAAAVAGATATGSSVPMEVDADVVRKALFNISSSGSVQSRRPVDFSVSLR
ncbi:unnamed protein product [Trichobilharzia szidati]|nr:unnamed protein product [Trichobilharzia szidati]